MIDETTGKKVYLDEARGTAYWLEGDEVVGAPMLIAGGWDEEDSFIVELWSEDGKEAEVAEEARVRGMLA